MDLDYSAEIAAALAEEEEKNKPSFPGQLWQGAKDVLSAPARFTNDLIKDYVSGATGTKMPEDFSAPRALASGLGLYQGDEGYAGTIARKGVETAAGAAWDPVTYAAFGLGGKAAKVAGATFTGLAAEGTVEAAKRAYTGWKEDGFTPQVAGDVFDTALQGAMAAAGTAHMAEKPLVASRILTEDAAVLAKRLERYKASGKTELYDMVKGEIDKRQAEIDALDKNVVDTRGQVLQGLVQQYPDIGLDKIKGTLDAVEAGELTEQDAHDILSRRVRPPANSAQEPGPMSPEQAALAARQAELLKGQQNPFAPGATEQLPLEGMPVEPVQQAIKEPPVDTALEYEDVPLTDLDVNSEKFKDASIDQILRNNPMSDVPNTAEPGLGSIEAQQAKVSEDIRIAQSPEQIFSMLDRLEQKTQPKPQRTLADVTPPRKVAPIAPERNPIDNQPVSGTIPVQETAPPLPGGDTGGMVNPEGSVVAGSGLPGGVAVPDNRPGPGLEQLQPARDFRGIGKATPPKIRTPRGRKAETSLDERGSRILKGQENWTPEEREVTHQAAEYEVKELAARQRAEPTGRRPYVRKGTGGTTSITGGDFYGVTSHKIGTPLAELPYTPKEMTEAMKKGGGNPIELDIHRAMRNSEVVDAELAKRAERLSETVPEGPVDTSFNPEEFEPKAETPETPKPKTKRAPKPKKVPDTPPEGAQPTHTFAGDPVIILGNVPEGTGLKGETVKVWDPKTKDWGLAKPEDLRPIAKTEASTGTPLKEQLKFAYEVLDTLPEGLHKERVLDTIEKLKKRIAEEPKTESAHGASYEGMEALHQISQEKMEVLADHARGLISDAEKTTRMERLNKAQEEYRGSQNLLEETADKTHREDLANMEEDSRVLNVKGAFQDLVDEISKVAAEAGFHDPMLQQTETTNLRHGGDLAANVSREGWRNTLGVNLPNMVDEFNHQMDLAKVPVGERAPHWMSFMREIAAHEIAHSEKGTSHIGDVVFDPHTGDWARTTTSRGQVGPTERLPQGGPTEGMQYHTLTEENIRRAIASRPTPHMDSLLTEAARPYVESVWADAQGAAKELKGLLAADKPVKVKTPGAKVESATAAPPVPPKAKKPQTPKQAQNQALKMNATIDRVQKRLKAAGHLTSQQIADLGALIRKDPSKAAAIERIAERPTLWGKINEGWKMGLISGPSTWVVKGVTDAGEMVFRVGETAVAPLVDKLLPGPRTRFEGETRARVEGSLSKLSEASAKFAQDMRDAFTVAPEKIDITRPVELQVGKIEGTKGTFIRTPGRVLNAITDFWRTTEAAGELRRRARQEAEKVGGGATAVKQMTDQIYKEALDPTNPKWEHLLKAANDAAAEQVFQSNNPGPFLNGLMKLRQRNPWLHSVLPFLEVPGNITKMLVQRTPLGFFKAAKDYKAWSEAVNAGAKPEVIAELKGKAVDSITRPLLGTTVMGAFGAYALTGGMTGGGPTDQKLKNEKLQAGWQPYSFKVGKTYVPFHRFEPVGSLLGIAADIAEARHSKNAEELLDKGLHSFGENFTNQSYMQSIADAMQFISDPKTAIKTYATSMAGSVVPNIVRRGAQALDPVVRDVKPRGAKLTDLPELMGRSVIAGIPGLSQTLPAKMSGTGDPIKRPGVAVTRFASPVQPSWENEDTPVLSHMEDVGFAPGVPAKKMRVQGVDVEMNEKEFEQVAAANRKAIEYVRKNYTDNPRFRKLPPEQQKIYIQKMFNHFRDEAKAKVQATSAFQRRIREARAEAR